ncbi:sulfotransferase family 2 domain-containing protein [Shewanella youngdeokensis]|uniref:Sulfotransferase family 2 domain-containing protein n=1 Tax=Shewanella youngdeokensis TaxID=2999068 RepID=A0ABZ0K1H8_9GAMM|nr:sulfotransferase family 2 domain-containing protein [Shewanella sp. DAU334]
MIYYFPHIPKAGGTTLRKIFYNAFGPERCLKIWNGFNSDCDAESFALFDKFNEFDCIVGHLSLPSFLLNKYAAEMLKQGEVKVITSIREPMERLISQYNYTKLNKKHPHYHRIQNVEIEQYLLNQPCNQQSTFLAIDNVNVVGNISVCNVENSIPFFANYLSKIVGRDVSTNVVPTNLTRDLDPSASLYDVEDISEDVKLQFKANHSLDYQLYERLK